MDTVFVKNFAQSYLVLRDQKQQQEKEHQNEGETSRFNAMLHSREPF